jgi:hypothetical protein
VGENGRFFFFTNNDSEEEEEEEEDDTLILDAFEQFMTPMVSHFLHPPK